MKQLTVIRDPVTGVDTIEGMSREEFARLAGDLMPPPLELNCARPLRYSSIEAKTSDADDPDALTVRVHSIYHGSVVEGPGRRSVLQVQGCPIRCPGCYVPQTHPADGGVQMSVGDVLERLLEPEGEPRDGASVLGGEPFAQPAALAAILQALDERGIHATVYTGYTFEQLRRRREPEVRRALILTKLLIEGPFVQKLSEGAGEWRGSRNQRIIPIPGLWV